MQIFLGLVIPFIGTTLGAAMVFLMKKEMNKKVEKILLGFASGVMIAASVWSLLIPSIEMAETQGKVAWIPAAIGFLLGIVFLLVLDSVVPHIHLESEKPEGMKAKLKKTTMMVFAVTLHNIPEGMAVGVAFGGIANNVPRNDNNWSYYVGNWNRHSKFSGRSSSCITIKKRRLFKI